MTDFVSVETVIRLVKLRGSDAVRDGELLRVYPKDGVPVVYQIPATGLARRVIIEIGKRTGVPSHWFWNPDWASVEVEEVVEARPLRVLSGGKSDKAKK